MSASPSQREGAAVRAPRERPLRVCIVRQRDVYEPQIQRVAEALARAGYDVEVLRMRGKDEPRTTTVNGVRITGLRSSLGRSSKLRYVFDYGWFFTIAASTLTARHLRRRYAAIQVYTMPDFLVFAGAVPKLLGSRLVAYMNEPTPELFETLYETKRFERPLQRIEQAVLRFADHAITVTEQLKQRYVERGADPEGITVILNAADSASDTAGWTPPAEASKDEFVVMCHGAVEDRYGHDTIVEAARLLSDELPDLRVVFTGRGSNEDGLRELIDEAGVGDIVRFEGFVSRERLNDLLHTADAGIVAQKASPYSHLVHTYKMVDYWIFGLPVIASRLHATADVYDDSVIEYFEPGDAADLARAIKRLHDDPARRAELAENGRRSEQESGWGVQQERFLGVYEALLGRDGSDEPVGATSAPRSSS
jgi:glycosyltransferase involved in cell wall biosynthesis